MPWMAEYIEHMTVDTYFYASDKNTLPYLLHGVIEILAVWLAQFRIRIGDC